MGKFSLTLVVWTSLFFVNSYAVNIQQFTRSNSLTFEMLEDTRLPNSHVYNDFDTIITLGGSYVDSPLVVKDSGNSQQLDEIIPDMSAIHLGLGVYLAKDLMIGATTTYSMFETNTGESLKDFSDIHVTLRWRFLTRERWALSFIPQLGIPLEKGNFTATQTNSSVIGNSNFLSDDSYGYGAKLAYEHLFSWGQIVTNLGFRHSKDAIFQDIDMENQLYTGLGAYFPIKRSFGLNLEWARLWSFPLNNKNLNPNEFYVGVSAALTKRIHGFAGVGFGNPFDDSDGNDYRISAGIKFTPRFWRKERKLVTKAPVVAPVTSQVTDDVLAADNICDYKYVFGTTNTMVARFPNDVGTLSDVNKQVAAVAQRLAKRLQDIERIDVVGHTSSPGSDAYNLALSKRRAIAVVKKLIDEGIPKNIIFAKGKGERQLLVSPDNTEEKQAQNRRTEFQVKLRSEFQGCYE